MCSEISSKLKTRIQNAFSLRHFITIACNVEHVKLCTQSLSQSSTARDEVPRLRTRTDANCDFFSDGPMRTKLLTPDIVVQIAVHRSSDALQSHFPQGDQVPESKEVGERALHALQWIDVAAPHSCDKRFGR